MPPTTHYADSSGVAIAYQVIGDGPCDVLFVPGMISHLDLQWYDPLFSDSLLRLGSFARLIVMDQRGVGLSDHSAPAPTVDERVEDLIAVLDAAGSRRAVIIGQCHGGPPAAVLAATFPERVQGLVLLSTFACGLDDGRAPAAFPVDTYRRAMDALDHWGEGRSLQFFNPSRGATAPNRHLFAIFERAALRKGLARAVIRSTFDIDVRAALPCVQAPTLVAHCRESFLSFESAQYMADSIPGAELLALDGADHVPFAGAASTQLLPHLERFVRSTVASPALGVGSPGGTTVHPGPRADDHTRAERFGAVVFTDVVGSTATTESMGDSAWCRVIAHHDADARLAIARHGGECCKFTGDGHLAVFPSTVHAVTAVRELLGQAACRGIELRAGVHAGPFRPMGTDVIGTTVNVAARLVAVAAPGEVLLSDDAAQLMTGATIEFGPERKLELKGLSAPLVTRSLVPFGGDLASRPPRWPAPSERSSFAVSMVDHAVARVSRHLPIAVRMWLGAR